jgi:hypothetical protein
MKKKRRSFFSAFTVYELESVIKKIVVNFCVKFGLMALVEDGEVEGPRLPGTEEQLHGIILFIVFSNF